jgi:hypothetical protein
MTDDRRIRIELTPDQTQQIKQTSGKEVSFIEFKVEELEQRIVPFCASGTHIPNQAYRRIFMPQPQAQ